MKLFSTLRLTAFSAVSAALLMLGTAALPACTKDVVLKTIDVQIKTNLEVDVKGGDLLAGTWTQELDPNSNADVRDNRSKIKKVVVEKLAYRVVESNNTPGTTGSGTWKFYLADAPADVFTLGTVTALDFEALDAADTVQDLPLSEAAKAKLVEAINSGKKVVFGFEGSVTERPSYTRFELRISTKIDVGV